MSGRRFTNAVVAARLARLADLLEIDGANAFRVRAYRGAAETIEAHPEAIADLLARGDDLTALKGIGKDLAAALAALFDEGEIPALREVAERVPVGLLEVVRVPGVGPKRAATLWRELGVTSLDDLDRAAREGRVAELAGFGAKTQAKVLAGVAQVRRHGGRVRLGDAEAALAPLLAAIRAASGVARVEVAGSLRRGRATVGDVDLLAVADEPAAAMATLRDHPDVAEVLGSGDTKTSVRLEGDLQVDLRVVPAASFGAAWQYFTGSKAHNVVLRQRAVDRGLRLSEYGLFRGGEGDHPERGERLAGADEEGVYRALGLAWVPPELREDRGEITAAADGRLPRLLEASDLRGDLHLHSTWSDGTAGIRAMRAACAERGYAYMAISDHSQALRMTGGLDPAKLARQWAELDEIAAEDAGRSDGDAPPTLLRGLEVDVLKDGRLDLDDDWLARLDLVIVSVHGHLDLPQAQQTERVVRALQHPEVNVLAHPTGRLLGSREGMALDLDAVFEAAAAHGVAVECNASPYRLDLGDVELMRAVAAGCRVAIDTDAHALAGLDDMRYGVATARRAWLGREHVINAWPLGRLRAFLAKRPAAEGA
ncbi:MAG: DNA polymerase/3'-5' exonuclease PolX [Trueperaceae bacterium]|nr:DNA polymerase/3'-5' exonuclease PolX [Trueperaceae bacterium]